MLKRLLFVLSASIFCLSVCSGEELDSIPGDTVSPRYVPVPPVKSVYLNEITVWDGLPILQLVTPGPVNDIQLKDFRGLHSPGVARLTELINGDVHRCLGYIGQPCYPNLRGSGPRSALYLRDGIPINDEMTGAFDLSFLSGAAFDRLEVLNDCGSSVYGPNACGGVVDLMTKKSSGGAPYSRVKVAGGGENFTDAELEFGRGFGGSWRGYVAGQHLHGDGFRPGTDFDIEDYSGDLSYDFGGAQAGVSLWRRDGKAGVPEDTLGSGQAYSTEDRLSLGSAYIRSSELDLRIYYKDAWHEDSDTVENTLGVRTVTNIGAQARRSVNFGRNRIVFGAAGRRRNVEAGDSISADIAEGGATVSAAFEVIPLVWVSPGVSVWHDETYGTELSPRVSALMAHSMGLTFFASFGRGFNSPTIAELFSPSSGNMELQAEHVLSYSGGLRYERHRVSIGLDAFAKETSDLIETEDDSTAIPLNSESKTDVRGANLRIGMELSRVFGGVNLRLSDSRRSGTEEDVPYTPSVAANGYAGCRGVFRKGDLGLSLVFEATYVGERLSDEGISLPAHSLVNGCAEMRIIDVRLYYRVENILDEEYESAAGYPAPPRTFIYGLEWDFWN